MCTEVDGTEMAAGVFVVISIRYQAGMGACMLSNGHINPSQYGIFVFICKIPF